MADLEKNKEYYLCYVKGNKAYFTSDLEHQWGDDWDDVPYEHNAGEPYADICELRMLYFEFPYEWIKLPCDDFLNSVYSVRDINRGDIAWIRGKDFNIPAKTTYEDFINIVENNGGVIYLLKENRLNSNED